ncbi:NAD(P)/FAD-dependent oxidoreductase [Salinibacterium sp. NG22]|uniref:dihydrolipoyl dehydrogenase family protein n=1 Tax=Salinibacterium sp. NG22 TaxID=2792040 RepID=UPI0018CCA2FF|nr:NAD(P)/FAD-dependent oxidoreductase [Salinibacterium sp. NG22]MBH0109173.1 NAD(P)/FAD-dependent oxidoreductase [Salinibacterium sp. NG22]
MSDNNYDLLVIGAGMAGIAAAKKTASRGWRVGIVDALPYGGTCALRGCDPKKILRRAAEIVDSARLFAGKGVNADDLSVNWADLMQHKHGFTDPVPESMEKGLKAAGVDTLHGIATFIDTNHIEIDGTKFQANKFLIATGAVPRELDFPGHEHLIDSTGFLNLSELPRRIAFIGGGFVSFEFAHIAARAGSTPVVIDRGRIPLKGFDPDLVELLLKRGESAGVAVRRETTIASVEKLAQGFRVTTQQGGTESTMDVDLVVHGAGRTADLGRLNLEAANVAFGPRGIQVSEHLQSTTNPDVYAAGDAADTPGMPLTPVAVFEAKIAASNMLKPNSATPDYSAIPTAVFTIPELVRVGMLEHEAKESGLDVDVRFTDTSGWFSNYRIGETTGATKILVDKSTDRIIGAHLLGHDYAELANTVALAMKNGLTTRQIKATTAAYPSTGSDLGSMV